VTIVYYRKIIPKPPFSIPFSWLFIGEDIISYVTLTRGEKKIPSARQCYSTMHVYVVKKQAFFCTNFFPHIL